MASNETLRELARKVQDINQPVEQRRAALRHIAALRGEPEYLANQVPDDQIGAVAAAMTMWPDGLKGLTMKHAWEAIQEGRARRMAGMGKR